MDGWSHLNSDSWCYRIGLAEETTGETTGMRFAPHLYQINVFDYENSEVFTFTESPPQGCSCWGVESCVFQMKVLASDGPGRLLCTRLARLRTWPRFVMNKNPSSCDRVYLVQNKLAWCWSSHFSSYMPFTFILFHLSLIFFLPEKMNKLNDGPHFSSYSSFTAHPTRTFTSAAPFIAKKGTKMHPHLLDLPDLSTLSWATGDDHELSSYIL